MYYTEVMCVVGSRWMWLTRWETVWRSIRVNGQTSTLR